MGRENAVELTAVLSRCASVFRVALLSLVALQAVPSAATTITFTSGDRVATVVTMGQYDNRELGYWNGNPLSESNQPTAYENQLSATWNFFVTEAERNVLYLQVTDVRDTTWGWVTGSPFTLIALTSFSFGFGDHHPLVTGEDASYSSAFANPGQYLATGSGPQFLDETPGWDFTGTQESFSLQASSVGYAFTHFSSVWGTTRIVGGGVFQFTFQPQFDLRRHVDFTSLTAEASHGFGAYSAPGELTYALAPPVPEPQTYALMLAGLGFLVAARRTRAAKRR